jgi:hypothetical protein
MTSMAAAFGEAARRRPDELVVSWIDSPGGPVRLRVVGRRLAGHLDGSLGHLAAAGQAPALRVDLWDEAVTGVPCPVPTAHGTFPRDVNGTPVRLCPESNTIWTAGHGAVTEVALEAGRMVGWRADGSQLSIEERGRPFPVALQAWLQTRGVVTLHAAAVACEGRAALIVGDSGSGKSTAALACAAAGFGFLGDDQVAVSGGEARVVVHSLFASARVDTTVVRLERSVPHTVHPAPNEAGKALVLLSDPATTVLRSAALAAIIVASVAPAAESALERAGAKDALRAMIPSTLLGVVLDRPAVLQSSARAVFGTRTYRLRSGRDLDAVPPLVAEALAQSQ